MEYYLEETPIAPLYSMIPRGAMGVSLRQYSINMGNGGAKLQTFKQIFV
jgi:hypothetical protein